MPEKTAEAFRGGWCTVGDMARRDADGYYLPGRPQEQHDHLGRRERLSVRGREPARRARQGEGRGGGRPARRQVGRARACGRGAARRLRRRARRRSSTGAAIASPATSGRARSRSSRDAEMPRTATGKILHRRACRDAACRAEEGARPMSEDSDAPRHGSQRATRSLRRLDRALPRAARRRPHLRPAGRPHPADLGPRGAARHPHRRRARRRRRRAHGARACGADRRLRRRHGDGGAGRHQHGDRDGERVSRPRAGAADRRLHLAAAGQHGAAAGHSACRHPAAGRPAQRARCASPSSWCASSTRRSRAPWATPASPARSISRSRPTCCGTQRAARAGARRMDGGEAAAHAAARSGRGRGGGRGAVVGAPAAGHHRPRRARAPAPSWCACSTPAARSISTPRRAAASCRPTIPRSSARCAPPP